MSSILGCSDRESFVRKAPLRALLRPPDFAERTALAPSLALGGLAVGRVSYEARVSLEEEIPDQAA